MSDGYTVLARRYRSLNFDELIGQEAIAQTLKNAVAGGRLAHAFLFTGTRGVGKTSSARILAKAINCPNTSAGKPCCTCSTCLAIGRGEDIDVIEIDGASNNGVEQIRDLRQNSGVMPSRSPCKIYIIDEVHMLSTPAFNALLKTLEEPPAHVKFILATTDVHKVPPTILSRCQRYDFKSISTVRIAGHLGKICEQEKVRAEPAALHRIALLAFGSMRDALSLLDRVLSLGAGHITETLLDELLGKPSVAALAGLVGAMADGDAALALRLVHAILAEGMAPEQALAELTEFFRNLMILCVCGEETDLLDVPAEWRGMLSKLAPRFDPPTLVHHIALGDQTLRSLRGSTMQRPLFDALIVRLALAPQFTSLREVLENIPPPGESIAPQKKNDSVMVRPQAVPATPAPAFSSAVAPPPVYQPPREEPPPHETAEAQAPGVHLETLWEKVEKHLLENKGAVVVKMFGGRARLSHLDAAAGTAQLEAPARLVNMGAGEKYRQSLETALGAVVGRPIRLRIVPAPGDPGGPAEVESPPTAAAPVPNARRVAPPELIRRAQAIPAVRRLIDQFGAQVVDVESPAADPPGESR